MKITAKVIKMNLDEFVEANQLSTDMAMGLNEIHSSSLNDKTNALGSWCM